MDQQFNSVVIVIRDKLTHPENHTFSTTNDRISDLDESIHGLSSHPVKKSFIETASVDDSHPQETCAEPLSVQIKADIKFVNTESFATSKNKTYYILLNNLPPVQAAFSIEKIRKLIFSYSNPNDLLKFRLVSSQWRRYATNDTLFAWKENEFHIRKLVGANDYTSTWKRKNKEFVQPLSSLIQLMDATGQNIFPCSRFLISHSNVNQNYEGLDEFLDKHGTRIKELTMRLYYYRSCNEIEKDIDCRCCSHGVTWVIEFITKLLKQVPNLVNVNVQVLATKDPAARTCSSIDSKNIVNIEENLTTTLYNLRSATLSEDTPDFVFQLICKSAPNLKEIWSSNLTNYIEPNNRLNLLKKCYFSIRKLNPSTYDRAKRLASSTNGELYLTFLSFKFIFFKYFDEDWVEVVSICNKLLEKSCRSLKSLSWTPLGFLSGLKVPMMENVRSIFFSHGKGFTNQFFPQGMLLATTFPNLSNIELEKNFPENFGNPVNVKFMFSSENEKMPSVRIFVKSGNCIDKETCQSRFPNAMIVDKY